MEIKFFDIEKITSGQDVKRQYKTLVFKHHPDVCADKAQATADMKQINAEYEYLLPYADSIETIACEQKHEKKVTHHDINDGYREIIEKIVFLEGIKIEIMGSWIWISGRTYNYADTFRKLTFKWSANKKAWYWYQGIDRKKFYKGHHNLNEVRRIWGCQEVESEQNKVLTCK